MFDVKIKRDEYATVLGVEVNGEEFDFLDAGTNRSIWTNGKIVVKVNGGVTEAQEEAETWLRLPPEARQWFVEPLHVEKDFVIQEFVPMHKPSFYTPDGVHNPLYERVPAFLVDLYAEYVGWDWQGDWVQCAIDTRTGLPIIHDYPQSKVAWDSNHHWTTLRISEAA